MRRHQFAVRFEVRSPRSLPSIAVKIADKHTVHLNLLRSGHLYQVLPPPVAESGRRCSVRISSAGSCVIDQMKTPNRYVFLLLFAVLFLCLAVHIASRLNELFSSSEPISPLRVQRNAIDFGKRVRPRIFRNYIDDQRLDESDSGHVNRSIWKQVTYKSPFSHQGALHVNLKN